MLDMIWLGRWRIFWLLLPFSWLYGAISRLRRFAYHRGWLASWRAPVPVVIVGNLTVGGNGKTPLVITLVEYLRQRGIAVGVVARGYGGQAVEYPLLLNEKTTAIQAGDEPVLIFQRTGVPVAVAPKRVAAVRCLLAAYRLDIILSDDGLQHYALQRDFEIVVIDGARRFGNGWWLPAGPMRERSERLNSVGAIVVNQAVANQRAAQDVAICDVVVNRGKVVSNINNDKPIAACEITMKLVASEAVNLLTGKKKSVTDLLSVIAMAGIGYPPRFFDMLAQMGVTVRRTIAFADHQPYSPEMLSPLALLGENLLMTEKDAIKCRHFAKQNWWYLPVTGQLEKIADEQLLKPILALCDASRVG